MARRFCSLSTTTRDARVGRRDSDGGTLVALAEYHVNKLVGFRLIADGDVAFEAATMDEVQDNSEARDALDKIESAEDESEDWERKIRKKVREVWSENPQDCAERPAARPAR